MQDKSKSNAERTRETRLALIAAARSLFVESGYGATSTPEIVRKASVTRGALYHHFKDKKDLFVAVLEAEAEAVAREISSKVSKQLEPTAALIVGGEAYLNAMAKPGRANLLLIDGPAVLGPEKVAEINAGQGDQELSDGLVHAVTLGKLGNLPVDPLRTILSAMYDAAALAVAKGERLADYKKVVAQIINRLIETD